MEPEIPREAGSCRRRRGGCRTPSEGIPNRAMRPHMRMDARSYAERGIAGGAGMRRSAADAPRATVGSTDPNAERTAAKRGGARSGRPRRQSNDWQMRRRSFASKGSRAGEAERTSKAKWTQGAARVARKRQHHFSCREYGWVGTAHRFGASTAWTDGTRKNG